MNQQGTTQLNNYPKHVGDFIRDTVGLSMMQDGAYNRLLDQYYVREAPLPLDEGELFRLARAASRPERAAVQYVLLTFFEKSSDGWRQKRADSELAAFQERSDSARRSAMASVQSRQRMREEMEANAQRTLNERSTSQKPEELKSSSKAKSKSSAREALSLSAQRLSSDWEPPAEWVQWAVAERGWTTVQTRFVVVKFRNYWLNRTGKGAAKLDWKATWQNWVLAEYLPAQREPTLAEKRVRTMDELTGKVRDERAIEGTAKRVGDAPVLSLPGDLREPGGDDVGRRGSG